MAYEEPTSPYLMYADGVLTAYDDTGKWNIILLQGTVSIDSDLTLKMVGDRFTVDARGLNAPALRLNGHTLTLSDNVELLLQTAKDGNNSEDSYAVASGIIEGQSGSASLKINNLDAAATKDLTIKNVPYVRIAGATASGGVVKNLTLVNSGATILQRSTSNTTVVEADQINTDHPVTLGTLTEGGNHSETIKQTGLMTTDGKIWAYGGDITNESPSYTLYPITTSDPTVWKAGEGLMFYEPAVEGTPAKLTLDNVTYKGSLVANMEDLSIVAKGKNHVTMILPDASAVVTTEDGGTLNTIMRQTIVDEENNEKSIDTLYGKVNLLEDICLEERPDGVSVFLTIAQGAELTIPSNKTLEIKKLEYFDNKGSIVNNGTVTLRDDAAENVTSETVKGLNLTGNVKVVTTDAEGSEVITTYNHNGLKLRESAGDLDLSNAGTEDATNWDTKGYKWTVENDPTDSSKIISGTLTLAEGFNATSVTLPDAAVTIETLGASSIGTLTPPGGDNAHANHTNLTFSGKEPLTVEERINIAGGDNNSITVAENANVIANGGIFIGGSGGVNSTVTVNGTLTIKPESGTAISAGSVAIGNSGVLEISGAEGVQLNGMPKLSDEQYKNLFTVTGNGRFTANCSSYNIRVSFTNENDLPQDGDGNPDAKAVINLGPEYMPDDCEPRVNINLQGIDLFRISTGAVYSGPLTIHKNHIWSDDWTDSGGDTHYYACTFDGCTAKKDETEHYYAHDSTVCRDCGHARPDGAPDSDDGSGDSNGGGSSGGNSDGDSSYTVTLEKPTHGTVTTNRTSATGGSTVTLTVTPDSGYVLESLTVTDSRGNDVKLTEKGGGQYAFTMPDWAVTVRAEFGRITGGYEDCPQDSTCPIWPFTDADTTAWYHDCVHYCLENGLMSGFGDGTFGPEKPITRAQLVQIVHNGEGRPSVHYMMQFEDVPSGAWYAEAVRWAASEGVVSGYSSYHFGPDDNITREQLAVILWRYAGSPASEGGLAFTDADAVSDYALEAMRWAAENGIINGKGGGILDPQGSTTRAEAAAMLMRILIK